MLMQGCGMVSQACEILTHGCIMLTLGCIMLTPGCLMFTQGCITHMQPWVMLMQGCILLMQGCVMLMQCRIENGQACIAVSQVHQHASSAIQSLLARQSFSAIKGAVSVSVLSPLASEGGRQGESCTRRDGRAGLPSGCCILWLAMEGGCYQTDRTELLLDLRRHESWV